MTEQESGTVRLLNIEQAVQDKPGSKSSSVIKVLKDLHDEPVRLLGFNSFLGYAITFTTNGVCEVWDPETYDMPEGLGFESMCDTDLYDLAESKPVAVVFSEFYCAILTIADGLRCHVFNARTLKLLKTFNESIEAFC